MTEDEIKKLLNDYVDAEMSFIDMENYKKCEFEPSDKYKKRIKKLFSVEKYFGKNIRFGYFVRRVAIFVVCLVGLMVATEVSAHFFEFDPWKYITSYLSDSKMEQRIYDESKKEDVYQSKVLKEAKHDFPVYIPDGLKKAEEDLSAVYSIYASWSSKEVVFVGLLS